MRKITVPTQLNQEMFEIAGYTVGSPLDDRCLGEAIAVTKCLIKYFTGRGDCNIFIYVLLQELNNLELLKDCREGEKNV